MTSCSPLWTRSRYYRTVVAGKVKRTVNLSSLRSVDKSLRDERGLSLRFAGDEAKEWNLTFKTAQDRERFAELVQRQRQRSATYAALYQSTPSSTRLRVLLASENDPVYDFSG